MTSKSKTGRSKTTRRGSVTVEPVMDTKNPDSDSDSDVTLMIFDPAKGELVPVHELE